MEREGANYSTPPMVLYTAYDAVVWLQGFVP